ncbi:MAG TPA: hypothetical protein VGT08_20545 [Terracidiphilus sp.]|nr:hypothetical protein [Terracidiphilus sp.]
MIMVDSMHVAKNRAAEALQSVLHQVSQIKLRNIDIDSPRPDLKIDILAQVDVHGHSHTLVCKVEASGRPDHVRTALDALRSHAAGLDGNTTRVFITPRISEETKALCGESKTGFLDLEGNARLDLGEVFIVKRTLRQSRRSSPSSVSGREDEELAGVA